MTGFIYFIFNFYANLIFIHIIISWIPGARQSRFGQTISMLVEPYLGTIRSFLPRIGMLDFSPIVGYILLELALYGIINTIGYL